MRLFIPTSYNATAEGIGNGSLDVAYFGGLTYVNDQMLSYVIVTWLLVALVDFGSERLRRRYRLLQVLP